MSQSNNLGTPFGATMCYGKAGLAEGTNAITLQILPPNSGVDISYSINGLMYAKATTDNIAMTVLGVQADLTSCYYLVQINAAGTVSIKRSTEYLTTDIAGTKYQLEWPRPDALNCPIGGFKAVMSGDTFTCGVDDITGLTGETFTYYDFACLPADAGQ